LAQFFKVSLGLFAKVGVTIFLLFPFSKLINVFKVLEVEVAKELLEMLQFELAAIGNAVEHIPLAHELDGFNLATEVIYVKCRSLGWLGIVEMEIAGEKRIGLRLAIAGDRMVHKGGDGSGRLNYVDKCCIL
jgi:hypothetical protein